MKRQKEGNEIEWLLITFQKYKRIYVETKAYYLY